MTGTRKRLLINISLILIVSGLAWLAHQQSQKEQQVDRLYSNLIGNTLTEVRIWVPNQAEMVLSAEGEEWFITQPERLKTNSQALKQLQTLLTEPVLASYDADGKNLDTFDLGDTAVRVQFNDVTYALGKLNPTNHQRYILLENKILLANEIVYELLTRGVNGFKEKE